MSDQAFTIGALGRESVLAMHIRCARQGAVRSLSPGLFFSADFRKTGSG